MLQRLTIRNYVIIDQLEIQFSPRLNIITGETGAGKSIILGALMLILGERADPDALSDKGTKCVIEAVFDSSDERIAQFLEEQGLDKEALIVIRREVLGSGKSRAFINDTPVNLDQLSGLGGFLADLHQQFDARKLGRADFQMDILDALCQHDQSLKGYRAAYRQWISCRRELDFLQKEQVSAARELDFNQFQLNELQEARLTSGELEALEVELSQLVHAEDIKSALTSASEELSEGESPILGRLRQLQGSLQPMSGYHPDLGTVITRLGAVLVELRDITGDISRTKEKVEYDPTRIAWINDRVGAGYRLLKKHGVKSTDELLAIQDGLEAKVRAAVGSGELIQELEAKVTLLRKELGILADRLSEKRKAQVNPTEEKVNLLLRQVGMPDARLKLEMRSAEPGEQGQDLVEFLFDANATGQFLPVRKVASGGELSRLMLCITSLVARSAELPTLIFDEIDSGISGEAARQVGFILRGLSRDHQVLCITHQPQIAGKGDAHFLVYKEAKAGRILTRIRPLNKEERINAIARMLGGEAPTAAALQSAREMIDN